jgi:hypothetical protein
MICAVPRRLTATATASGQPVRIAELTRSARRRPAPLWVSTTVQESKIRNPRDTTAETQGLTRIEAGARLWAASAGHTAMAGAPMPVNIRCCVLLALIGWGLAAIPTAASGDRGTAAPRPEPSAGHRLLALVRIRLPGARQNRQIAGHRCAAARRAVYG